MPFCARLVQPTEISRRRNGQAFKSHNELTNHSLSKALMQLASICHHTESIFGDLQTEAYQITQKIHLLQEKFNSVNKISNNLKSPRPASHPHQSDINDILLKNRQIEEAKIAARCGAPNAKWQLTIHEIKNIPNNEILGYDGSKIDLSDIINKNETLAANNNSTFGHLNNLNLTCLNSTTAARKDATKDGPVWKSKPAATTQTNLLDRSSIAVRDDERSLAIKSGLLTPILEQNNQFQKLPQENRIQLPQKRPNHIDNFVENDGPNSNKYSSVSVPFADFAFSAATGIEIHDFEKYKNNQPNIRESLAYKHLPDSLNLELNSPSKNQTGLDTLHRNMRKSQSMHQFTNNAHGNGYPLALSKSVVMHTIPENPNMSPSQIPQPAKNLNNTFLENGTLRKNISNTQFSNIEKINATELNPRQTPKRTVSLKNASASRVNHSKFGLQNGMAHHRMSQTQSSSNILDHQQQNNNNNNNFVRNQPNFRNSFHTTNLGSSAPKIRLGRTPAYQLQQQNRLVQQQLQLDQDSMLNSSTRVNTSYLHEISYPNLGQQTVKETMINYSTPERQPVNDILPAPPMHHLLETTNSKPSHTTYSPTPLVRSPLRPKNQPNFHHQMQNQPSPQTHPPAPPINPIHHPSTQPPPPSKSSNLCLVADNPILKSPNLHRPNFSIQPFSPPINELAIAHDIYHEPNILQPSNFGQTHPTPNLTINIQTHPPPPKISPKTDNTSSQDSGTGSQKDLAHQQQQHHHQQQPQPEYLPNSDTQPTTHSTKVQVKINSNSTHSNNSNNSNGQVSSSGFHSNTSQEAVKEEIKLEPDPESSSPSTSGTTPPDNANNDSNLTIKNDNLDQEEEFLIQRLSRQNFKNTSGSQTTASAGLLNIFTQPGAHDTTTTVHKKTSHKNFTSEPKPKSDEKLNNLPQSIFKPIKPPKPGRAAVENMISGLRHRNRSSEKVLIKSGLLPSPTLPVMETTFSADLPPPGEILMQKSPSEPYQLSSPVNKASVVKSLKFNANSDNLLLSIDSDIEVNEISQTTTEPFQNTSDLDDNTSNHSEASFTHITHQDMAQDFDTLHQIHSLKVHPVVSSTNESTPNRNLTSVSNTPEAKKVDLTKISQLESRIFDVSYSNLEEHTPTAGDVVTSVFSPTISSDFASPKLDKGLTDEDSTFEIKDDITASSFNFKSPEITLESVMNRSTRRKKKGLNLATATSSSAGSGHPSLSLNNSLITASNSSLLSNSSTSKDNMKFKNKLLKVGMSSLMDEVEISSASSRLLGSDKKMLLNDPFEDDSLKNPFAIIPNFDEEDQIIKSLRKEKVLTTTQALKSLEGVQLRHHRPPQTRSARFNKFTPPRPLSMLVENE